MKVGRYDYSHQFRDIEATVADIRSMLVEGRYVLGEDVRAFERDFAAYLGVSHARGVNSGTDALIIAMLALGIGPGDEVITQANTFNATVAAICFTGATPVLVDAEESGFELDPSGLEAAVTTRTKAVVPVHLYGKPGPLPEVLEFAGKHGLLVVEDAAQAHGARLDGRYVGTFGDVGCFSFHPSKNLAAAGDGGAIVTQDTAVAEQIQRLRELGQHGQNNHVVTGYNSKLDAIQARILATKLKHLDAWNEDRRRIAELYRNALNDMPLGFQSSGPGEEHVYHLFQIQTPLRDALLDHLQFHGVDAVVRYPTPIHLQPAFVHLGWREGQFPVAERLARELLCLPIRPGMSEAETDWVVDCVRSGLSPR